MEYLHADLTERIIRCFYNVFDNLGHGFLESVYEQALVYELEEAGFKIERQKDISVLYKGKKCGLFKADLVVDDKVIIELKAGKALSSVHEAQLLNYLKATKLKLGLLVNFGSKLEFKRKIFTN